MRLNHFDLHTPDVAATAAALGHFGLTVAETRGKDGLIIMTDGHGLELVVSRPVPSLGGCDQVSMGKTSYHIGFIVDDRTAVDRVRMQLVSAGLAPGEPRLMRGGWQFYCTIPGNILVEVGARALHV
jgi:hypothetical protein